MRLIITAIVCSLLVIGGFFGFKQYQRAGMKSEARAYVMKSVGVRAEAYSLEARDSVIEHIDELFSETFGDHYVSGGLTKPAEFNDAMFARDLFDRVDTAVQEADVSGEARRLAGELRQYSQPLNRGRFAGVPGGRDPSPADDEPADDDDPADEGPADDDAPGDDPPTDPPGS